MRTDQQEPAGPPFSDEPDGGQQERSREERIADEILRLRERDCLRARTSVAPPGG